jgi:hypothetical protein
LAHTQEGQMKNPATVVIAALAALALAAGAPAQTTVRTGVLGNGGALVGGSQNRLAGTIGQAAIGYVASDHRHGAGFWYWRVGSLIAVDDLPADIAAAPWLGGNAPNPFNPLTTIRFATAAPGRVTLRLYDLAGRQVRVLVDADLPAGIHATTLDGTGLASGVYVCRMSAGTYRQTRELTLVK